MPVGKSTLKEGLEGHGTGPDIPGSIFELRINQKPYSTLIRWIRYLEARSLTQCHQGLAGAVGVARECWDLRPASIRALLGEEGSRGFPNGILARRGPSQA